MRLNTTAKAMLIMASILAPLNGLTQPYTPGEPVFDANGYVEYIPGNLPIIISVPHGGYLEPLSIPDRDCEGCSYLRDSYTQEMARSMREEFIAKLSGHAYFIINLLHRKKFDANRAVGDAADGNAAVIQSWEAYHSFIELAKQEVISIHGRGLFIDLHGHAHPIERVELGYLLSRSELGAPNSQLNTPEYIGESSIQTLVSDNLEVLSHADLLRGAKSLGTLLNNKGYRAVPSRDDRYPYSDQPYFSGGYNTVRHGSLNKGDIDGIQIETNRDIRWNDSKRQQYAKDLTTALNWYIDLHYNADHLPGYYDPVTQLLQTDGHQLEIFPNPVEKYLKLRSDYGKIVISIQDYRGKEFAQLMWQGKDLDIGFLKTGLYILRLNKDDGTYIGNKVLIKK